MKKEQSLLECYLTILEKKIQKKHIFILKKFDGKAVTCEDFLNSIQKFSKTDLSKFSKWYNQKGTINLIVKRKYLKNRGLELTIQQKNKFCRSVVPIPVKNKFFDQKGIKLNLNFK